MLRTALTPRLLGLLVLALAIAAACVELGLWQLGVARDTGRAEAVARAASRPVAPVSRVLDPHSPFPVTAGNRRVRATGHYLASGQEVVVDRRLEGRRGVWVVLPLVLDTGPDAGATLPVLRGFVPAGADVPHPPAGRVEVTGALSVGEPPADPGAADLPAGRIHSIDLSVLVNRWPGPMFNAFVFATAETRPGGSALAADVTRVPPPTADTGLAWRNAAYAVQWWIFGAFALWMWLRIVRDDARRERADPRAPTPSPPPRPPGPTRPGRERTPT